MDEFTNVLAILVEKPEGTRPLGRRRRKWEVKVKMELRDRVLECVVWINLA
jgi:hypothetical protein